jgi:hypothetical protein
MNTKAYFEVLHTSASLMFPCRNIISDINSTIAIFCDDVTYFGGSVQTFQWPLILRTVIHPNDGSSRILRTVSTLIATWRHIPQRDLYSQSPPWGAHLSLGCEYAATSHYSHKIARSDVHSVSLYIYHTDKRKRRVYFLMGTTFYVTCHVLYNVFFL